MTLSGGVGRIAASGGNIFSSPRIFLVNEICNGCDEGKCYDSAHNTSGYGTGVVGFFVPIAGLWSALYIFRVIARSPAEIGYTSAE